MSTEYAAVAVNPYQTAAVISPEERERLILEHLPQVRLIARRIHERLPESVSLEDLVSTGIVGLISAGVDGYEGIVRGVTPPVPRLNLRRPFEKKF